jgi:hypothetical protein
MTRKVQKVENNTNKKKKKKKKSNLEGNMTRQFFKNYCLINYLKKK